MCEKARLFYSDVTLIMPGTSASLSDFKNKRGSFEKFKRQKISSRSHMPLRCLLIIENVPSNPSSLKDTLLEDLTFIKVEFSPLIPCLIPLSKPWIRKSFQISKNFTGKQNFTGALR